MNIKTEVKLKQILENNPSHTIILVGDDDLNLENSVQLSAAVDERELHIPMVWHKLVDMKAKKAKTYLIIEGLDQLDEQKQEKFAGLLKDHRAGNYKLPANVQIVIPVREKDKVSQKIQSLSLLWEIK